MITHLVALLCRQGFAPFNVSGRIRLWLSPVVSARGYKAGNAFLSQALFKIEILAGYSPIKTRRAVMVGMTFCKNW
eukprot:scaffold3803_cov95-Skeletonema_dohrnii-CCMP3373.AAC.3